MSGLTSKIPSHLIPGVGILKFRKLRNSTGTANHRMKGRNLPQRVMTLSTARPANRSVKASHRRTTRNIVPTAAADRPPTSVK